MKKKKQEFNLDAIIDEFNVSNRDDRDTIQAVLAHCPLNFRVSFALQCALDVEHLMTDVRSKQALRAVELFLSEGTPLPQEVIDYAYAAYDYAYDSASAASDSAAYAAYAYAASAAYAAYAAYDSAAYASDSAAYASTYDSGYYPNVYKEKMREYLIKLKELILAEIPANQSSWLLEVAI